MGNPIPVARRPSAAMVWLCILSAVTVVAVVGSIIAIYDVQRAVADRRDDETRRLRQNAERSAGQIESQLQERGPPYDLESIRDATWLRRYWTRNLALQPGRIYAAVTDRDGKIIAHTRREEENNWVDLQPTGKGGDLHATALVETADEILTAGIRALDMRVPIVLNDQSLGVYHTGLDASWLDGQMADERRNRTTFWLTLVAGTSGLLLLSSVAVVGITRRTARLEHELEAANARRVSEMHELVLGIAHEIRNPLNAIRLNLHTVGQVFRDEAHLGDEEIGDMLDEMEGEIERLEALMREMLGFARTAQKAAGPIDLCDEIRRTLTLLRPNLERQRVQVHLQLPDESGMVMMEASRVRQVLLNLVHNGAEAVGEGGTIEIEVRQVRGQIELSVSDDGPGIPPEDRERVFVPFFSTKASGTGLGLAVARKFVEEAGGTITCEESSLHKGCRFRVALPASSPTKVEGVL